MTSIKCTYRSTDTGDVGVGVTSGNLSGSLSGTGDDTCAVWRDDSVRRTRKEGKRMRRECGKVKEKLKEGMERCFV